MRNIDDLIEEALGKEEREILRQIGEEPGFFGMAFGIFSGRLGWANMVMVAAQTLAFVAGVYAAWMFFEAVDVVSQLRWGLPAAVLLILATMIKMALLPEIHANRLMRELKRIELQLARAKQA
jgi:hypothetical protein